MADDRSSIATSNSEDAAAHFAPLRPKLMRVAYRMLGTIADAEDIVQEGFIRWVNTDRTVIRNPEAYLCRVVTRLCLDQLKSARSQREAYIGLWLPAPVVEDVADEDISLPMMLALERLSPLERAAFLLHDVFGLDFAEVAMIIRREIEACRQLAARARVHARETRPRFQVERQRGLEIARAFFTASRTGDIKALGAMLADDVSIHADGGGKRPAVREPILGFGSVMRFFEARTANMRQAESKLVRTAFINGLPGFVTLEADGELQTTAFEMDSGKIAAIYVVRNPDKLRHLH